MGRHLPTRTRRPWLFSFSLTTIVVAPPLRTTRRECGRGEERDQRGLVLLFTAWTGLPSTGEPADFVIHPMFTLVRSLFIQCSLLTLRFFGWRTTDSFPMSFPLVRIIRSSYNPHAYGTYIIQNFCIMYTIILLYGGGGGRDEGSLGPMGGREIIV